ncbi:MAG: gluconate 2-dehydrogenase subunit 3 family protein [Flavobacteriaceae bacterium]
MNRRDSIRSLFLGSMAGSLALESCISAPEEVINDKVWQYQYGRTPAEAAHDEKLLAEQFLENSELNAITRLANLILPPTEEGTIEQAGVPEFIEFMTKDFPSIQTPIRGGLMWLDNHTNKTYGKNFIDCTEEEQHQVLDLIAYPEPKAKEQKQEVQFFSLMRNLVLTGYFTSPQGIKELGYQGNQPNVWDGVPEDVLKAHGMSYDEDWKPKFVDQSKRNDTAAWDEDGNLIT